MLPNVLCIGAQKSGTTAIWRMLDAHPDIYMARPRETRFFCDDFQFQGGVHNYEIAYFGSWNGQAAAGEKCPEYLYAPEVPLRIREQLGPEIKFIVTLRNPAERAFSHYRHNLAMLREHRTFSAVIEQEAALLAEGRLPPIPFGYVGRGLYARQLKRYLGLFPAENFLFVSFEREVTGDQQQLADRIYAFLGVGSLQLAGLPFYDGKPPLAHLTVQIRPATDATTRPTVDIARRSFVRRRPRSLQALLARLHQRPSVSGTIESRRILNPSPALLDFAEAFNRHRPTATRLTPAEALTINHQHFAEDIAQLAPLVPFAVTDWLSRSSCREAP